VAAAAADAGRPLTAQPAFAGPVRHVYVHVPFCRARCDYCEFYSLAVGEQPDAALLDQYVDAVLAEWRREAARLAVRRLETLFLGGGTPSLLGPARLDRLLAAFAPYLTPHAEVTIETNPEDVDEAFAAWAAGGPGGMAARRPKLRPASGQPQLSQRAVAPLLSRRISLGVQSFQAGQRAALGRYTHADPETAFRRLRAAGVTNLSIDLIFGLAGQSEADLDADLAAVAALRPDHVSWYELGIVAGTALADRLGGAGEGSAAATAGGSAANADERAEAIDRNAALYRRLVRGLGRLGYRWYEVSNFALPGRQGRHNVAYWRGRPYLGLGPSAVSTVADERWRNLADTPAYLRAMMGAGQTIGGATKVGGFGGATSAEDVLVPLPAPPRASEHLDQATRARERLLLAARIGAAVPLGELDPCLDHAALGPLASGGYIALRGGTLRITRKGRYVANAVSVRLFRDTCF
jgi:oxygen-independent coproporphyrinogen-3 oxidase